MKLIFAQGNPGAEYESTRHNVGFSLVDFFAKKQGVVFSEKTKFQSHVADFLYNGEKIILAKPTTFYNETGQAARALADFYKILPEDILVLHDELALPFGVIRVRKGGSAAGNNGIKSLNSHLGEDFWRIRIGISTEQKNRMSDANFVLASYTSQELTLLEKEIFSACYPLLTDFLDKKICATSQRISTEKMLQ